MDESSSVSGGEGMALGIARQTARNAGNDGEEVYLAEPFDEALDDELASEEKTVELISSFRPSDDMSGTTRDEISAYIQAIARTPLLTVEEEVACFERFEAASQRVSSLLNQLPLPILHRVRQRERLRTKRKTNEARWWSSMHISDIVEQVKAELKVYQAEGKTAASPNEEPAGLVARLCHAVQQLQEAKAQIVEANLLLVVSIVKQLYYPRSPLSFLDAIQEGSIGLMRAVEKFDLARGNRFSTYATWWIRQAVKRAIDEQCQNIRLPAYVWEAQRAIRQAQTELTRELGREPSYEEVAEAVGMTEERTVEILQGARGTVSLSSPIDEAESEAVISDLVADPSQLSPEDELMSRSGEALLDDILDTLNEREALIIKLRYGLYDSIEYTLAEIGRKLGISRERVRQIESGAMDKLREHSRRQRLKELF